MSSHKIVIILPFKEKLNPKLAGAVSVYVKDSYKYSKFKKNISILSSDNFNNKIFKNKNYILDFCKKNKKKKFDIIEIHNRPEYVFYIKKFFPDTKIILTFHNDPIKMRGSKILENREKLLKNCYKIVFISRWIQQRFFTSFKNSNYSDTEIIYHGVQKINVDIKKKQKNILFVGKLNESKGYSIFVEAAKKFKIKNKDWNFIAIGNESRKKIFPDNDLINEIGYKTNTEVLEYYKKSEIAVGNSVWNEPLGRIAIEASSRKCLPVISDIAGLKESNHIGLVLKKNNSTELAKTLLDLTKSSKIRKNLQNKFYLKNNFNIKKISKKIDTLRENILVKKDNKNIQEKIKILHIANFNELSEGRLFYSFANKLNNGFIKRKHIVQTISDRVFLKYNKNILNPFGNFKNFNKKILNTIKNFSPNLLIFGHVFNVDQSIFNYCKINNIKTANWFIDSISNEFLNGKKKDDLFNLVNNCDESFITSSPHLFKKKKFYNKLHYIPNPVDSSIDFNKNYKKKNLEYDIFLAISHGQNRAILKKGKFDEREKLFSYLKKELNNRKIGAFGFNNNEPIWGSNYFDHLTNSKISINLSRGKYQNLYSSDRISSLIGNGLLVFIENKTNLQKILKDKKEVIFFNDKLDLVKKINYYLDNEKLRKKIAENGRNNYHRKFNNLILVDYILSKLNFNKKKINWF